MFLFNVSCYFCCVCGLWFVVGGFVMSCFLVVVVLCPMLYWGGHVCCLQMCGLHMCGLHMCGYSSYCNVLVMVAWAFGCMLPWWHVGLVVFCYCMGMVCVWLIVV